MTTTPNGSTAEGSLPPIHAAWQLLNLGRELAGTCLWAVLTRLPLAVGVCTLISLVLAMLPAYALLSRGENSLTAHACLAILTGLYLLAGVVWGFHRALRCGVATGLAVLDKRLPEVIDGLLTPLVQLGEGRIPAIDIAEARRRLGEASENLFDVPAGWRWLRRPTFAVARWWLRTELGVMDRLLASIEQRGDRCLSAASLAAFARDGITTHTRCLAEMNLRQLDLLAALVVFGLLVGPAAFFSWIEV